MLADDEGEFRFRIIFLDRRNIREIYHASGAEQLGRLMEKFVGQQVDRALGIVEIIDECREAPARPRDRREKLYACERHTFGATDDALDFAAQRFEIFDQHLHHALRSSFGPMADGIAHIDDMGCIFKNTDPIIVKS